jgi:N-hydroxyarylamine O-acetyltransferase
MTLDATTVDKYLARLGVERPLKPDLETLRTLQERHIRSIPFENIDCFRRTPLRLGAGAVEKIVEQRRGGGCFELNSAFGLLLEALGYRVTILGGRIYSGEELSFPLRHLVLRVDTTEGSWLVDSGFGFGGNRNSTHPLRLEDRSVQPDPLGEYRLAYTMDGDVDVLLNERPLYRIELHPRPLHEFSAVLWWFLTAPDSDFLEGMFCILPTESGRISLRDRSLSRLSNGEKIKTELADEDEVRSALVESFGIEVDEIPDLEVPADKVGALLGEAVVRAGGTAIGDVDH